GQKIEVTDATFKSASGTFLSVSEEAITFRKRKSEVKVERPNVLRVRLLEGSHRTRWTLIGMCVGAAAGAAIGVLASSTGNKGEGAILALRYLPIPTGAGVGAALGMAVSHGPRTLYKAKNRSIQKTP